MLQGGFLSQHLHQSTWSEDNHGSSRLDTETAFPNHLVQAGHDVSRVYPTSTVLRIHTSVPIHCHRSSTPAQGDY